MQGFLGRAHEPQHLVLLMGKICHHHMAEMCSWVCGGEGAQEESEGSRVQAPRALPTGATQSSASSLPREAR